MGQETGTYISDLVTTNPVDNTDTVASLGGQTRFIKSTVKATFPNVSGAMTKTHAQLNALREVLSSARTYYVRTDGSDSNTGLANTSGAAFLTIQKAYDTIAGLDLNGFTAEIHVGAGTYTGGLDATQALVGGDDVSLIGDTTTPTNVIISTTGDCISVQTVVHLLVDGFKLVSSAGCGCYSANPGAYIEVARVNFGACAVVHNLAFAGGQIAVGNEDYTISGGALNHFNASSAGTIFSFGTPTVALSGTPAFGTSFALAQKESLLDVAGITFSGSATGPRYLVTGNSMIDTAGAGANYFPGNSAGSSATGGQYV